MPYGGGGGGHIIADEGTALANKGTLNFAGAGVTAANVGNSTVVTIPGGAPGSVNIGDPIGGGTAGRVLFEAAGPVLADDAQLTYDAATDRLTVGGLTASSGSIIALAGTVTTTLAVADVDVSNILTFGIANLTADRILTIDVNDASRSLTISGNSTINQDVSTAGSPSFVNPVAQTAFLPDANDGAALGTTALQFSDLFLAEGGVINWDNGDATLTQVANMVTLAGADLTVDNLIANTALLPDANDGAAIGTTALQWSDLFLAEGGVINWDNGDATLTQVNNVVTLAGAELVLSAPANNAGSVLTTDGAQTLTNKTITAAVASGTWTTSGTWTLPAFTMGGNIQMNENVSLILDAALSADGKYSGITEAGTAGTTLAFGDLVYLAVADSRWELTDADADATSGAVKIGMCVLAAAADGDPTTILLWGKIRADANFPALTVGAPVYISTTAGDIQTAQPSGTDDVIRIIGYGNTADELFFCPSNDYMTHT